jgi:hypothetical protein
MMSWFLFECTKMWFSLDNLAMAFFISSLAYGIVGYFTCSNITWVAALLCLLLWMFRAMTNPRSQKVLRVHVPRPCFVDIRSVDEKGMAIRKAFRYHVANRIILSILWDL